jgi:tripartite-type tricarboxylate transporter receptor subunit TctC
MRFTKLFSTLALAALGALATQALAQTWPTRQVTLIIPFPPAGPTDILARAFAPALEAAWKQPFVIEFRPGAGGMLGTGEVSRAKPDGYTLVLQANGVVLAPIFQKSIPYDPADLRPVVGVASSSYLVVTNPATAAKTLGEFVALAKGRPKQVNYGTIPYTPFDLDYHVFQQRAGVELTTINYNGAAAMAEALMRGDIQMFFGTPAAVIPLVKAGKLVPIAYTSPTRGVLFPDVPTAREQGIDLVAGFTLGLWAPAKTPDDIASKIGADVDQPAHRQYPQQMQAELKGYTEVAQKIGLKPQ